MFAVLSSSINIARYGSYALTGWLSRTRVQVLVRVWFLFVILSMGVVRCGRSGKSITTIPGNIDTAATQKSFSIKLI